MEPEVTTEVVEEQPNGMESVSEGNGENPSWQELYGVLPDSLHSIVAPVLEKWEKNASTKFEANAAAQLAYEPYQQFLDNNIGSDQIEQALSVAQLIDADPKAFMKQMQDYFGEDTSQVQSKEPVEQNEESEDFETKPYDLSSDPHFKKIQEQQDVIAGFLSQQVEDTRKSQEDAQLEVSLKELTTKYGAFDQDYVFGLALNDVPLEDAVIKYHSMVESIRKAPAADADLPNILTPGGGMPSEQISPADMSKNERMALVMNILAQANKT